MRFSIKKKFLLGFSAAFIPAFFLFNFFIFDNIKRNLEDENHETMGILTSNAAVIADEYLLTNETDLLSLQQIVVNLAQNSDIMEAYIEDNNRVIIAHSDIEKIDTVPEKEKSGREGVVAEGEDWFATRAGRQFMVRSYVRDSSGVIKASVVMMYEQISILKVIRNAAIKNSIVTIITMALIMALTFLITEYLTRPLRRLHKGVQEVSMGNMDINIRAYSSDEIGDLTKEFNIMVKNLKEQEIIKDMFSKYLSPDIAEHILANRESISFGGEVRRLSVMFADIRGFTAFSENFPPGDIVRFLNSYLTRMVDIIFQYHGTLDKFLGDGVLAIYGAPLFDDDHAFNAVKSGLDMIRHIEEYNKQRVRWGETPMYIGLGINTGDAIIGNIGSRQRTEYTVIGDTVNTASRLEGLAQENQLLVAASTFEEIRDRVIYEHKGKFEVKNKKEPVDVYLIKGLIHG